MSGGVEFHSWKGVGEGWAYPSDPTIGIRTANQVPRWMPKSYSLSSEVMNPSPKNQSGQSQESIHAGVKTAHKSDNIGKM
jgi:hypothetical protein